jgi:hypothetical protein
MRSQWVSVGRRCKILQRIKFGRPVGHFFFGDDAIAETEASRSGRAPP